MYRRNGGRPSAARRWERSPGGIWLETVKRLGPLAFFHGANATYDGDSLVSQWTDLSGHGYHATQTTADDKPTLATTAGGDSYLLIDNDDGTGGKALVCNALAAAMSAATALTVGIACRALDYSTGILLSCDGGDFAIIRGRTDASNGFIRVQVNAQTTDTAAGTWQVNADHVLLVSYDGGQAANDDRLTIYKDNAVVVPTYGTVATQLPALVAGAIGRSTVASGSPVDAWLYSLVVFPRVLPTAERLMFNNALKQGLAFY